MCIIRKLLSFFYIKKKEIRIVMAGLDAAGKTTMLYKLMLQEIVTNMPTVGANVETLEYKNINYLMFDLGGQGMYRHPITIFLHDVRGLIFVVDSNDHARMLEARDLLYMMLKHDQLKDTVLLVCANKQDLPGAMNAAEIAEKLGLHSLELQCWSIQSTSAKTGEGLYEGLDWLSTNIANKVCKQAEIELMFPYDPSRDQTQRFSSTKGSFHTRFLK